METLTKWSNTMHLDIDHNKTTIWTVDEIDELIDDIDKSKKSKLKRAETLDNIKRVLLDLIEQNAILIVNNDAE